MTKTPWSIFDPVIPIRVKIRREDTREIRQQIWTDWAWNSYWWEEGNASRNEVRKEFFMRMGGETMTEATGVEEEYSVNIENAQTNEVLYDEWNA